MPKQKQNPEIADGFWCSQMPKQKQNPEIADGFWCSPSITEMDYGENTSNSIINLGVYVYLFIIFDVNIFLCKMFTFYI